MDIIVQRLSSVIKKVGDVRYIIGTGDGHVTVHYNCSSPILYNSVVIYPLLQSTYSPLKSLYKKFKGSSPCLGCYKCTNYRIIDWGSMNSVCINICPICFYKDEYILKLLLVTELRDIIPDVHDIIKDMLIKIITL